MFRFLHFDSLQKAARTLSQRQRTLLTGALVLILFSVGVLWVTARVTEASSLAALLNRGDQDLQLYIANIRRELDRYEYLPKVLVDDYRVSRTLHNPEDKDARATLNTYLKFVARSSGASDIYLMDTAGITLAASNWDQPDSFIGDDYSFRPYFKQAIKGQPGDYFALGMSSGQRGYYFAYPVREHEKVIGVMVVKVPLASLEEERGGGHYEFLVTDPDGVIFLATEPRWRYHTLTPLAEDQRKRIEAGRRYLDFPLVPLPATHVAPFAGNAQLMTLTIDGRGVTYLLRGVEMPQAGWTVYILLNIAPVATDVTHAVLLAAFSLGVLVLLSLILLQRRARLDERVRYEHAAMEAAEASEARIRATIASTRAGLVTLDARGHIESFNPTAESLFERLSTQVTGLTLGDLLTPESASVFSAMVRAASHPHAQPHPQPLVELTGRRDGGETFPLEAAINRMTSLEAMHFIVTLHDISERKEQEAALQQAHDQLERRVAERTGDLLDTNRRLTHEIEEHRRTEAELRHTRNELIQTAKLAAIGELAAGINHELNQPLTAIRFYAGNAKTFMHKSQVHKVEENLDHIDGLTEHMGRIISQLKLFARKSSGKPVPVSMNAVIDGALTLLEPRLQRQQVAVIRHLPVQEVLCLGDMVRLEQVLVNLIGNALQAMESVPDAALYLEVTTAEGLVMTAIRDRGPGIPEDQLAQIFDPFFTTKEIGEGLGLGLSISLRIIEELGGTLRAHNHPEGGAVLTLELATAPAHEAHND